MANGVSHEPLSLLYSEERDFLLRNNGDQVPISYLEGKMVGLYIAGHYLKQCHQYTQKLVDFYKKLKEKDENFEIVLVSLDYEEESFNQWLDLMPWLALPFTDECCEKLYSCFQQETLPTLVIIGPDGKTLNPNATELIEEYGVEAYPFTPEKVAEIDKIEKARLEAQTLESILVSGKRDFVIQKCGSKVRVSELVGKNIVLYFSAGWCPPCLVFQLKLIEAYHEIKAKDNEFEVIFISFDHDQPSFNDFFRSMPWLALPFGDDRKEFLKQKFKIEYLPAVIAIGPSGQTVLTKEGRLAITIHGADAYPFTEEQLKLAEEKLEEKAKGWPEKLKYEGHVELTRSRGSGYTCSGCSAMGHGWSFYCKNCDLYFHPNCALKER